MTHESLLGWRAWIMNVLIGLDQFGNTLLGGHPAETISSRAGRADHAGHAAGRWLCRALNRLDPGHCETAIQSEDAGTHRPPPLTPAERQAILDRLKRIKGDPDGENRSAK